MNFDSQFSATFVEVFTNIITLISFLWAFDNEQKSIFGFGKSKEVPDAIKKAVDDAFKNIIEVKLNGSTITHDIEVKYNASRILLKPASEGTGVIAGGSVRPVLELAGVKDILTKSLGSNNSSNVVRATMKALSMLKH